MPFIEEILNNIRAIVCDLEPHQVHTFYEAVGYMISAQTVSAPPTWRNIDIDVFSLSLGWCGSE